MALLDVYNNSKSINVLQAKQIPNEETDFFDLQHTFSVGFTTNLNGGDPTQFTTAALNYFDSLEKNFVPPPSFTPLDGAPGLDAWTENAPYGDPGLPQT